MRNTIGNVCGFWLNDTIHVYTDYNVYLSNIFNYIISSGPSINEHDVLSLIFLKTRLSLHPKLVNLSSHMLSFETFSVVDRQEESPMTDASSSKTTDREENGCDTIRRIDSLESLEFGWMDGWAVCTAVCICWRLIYLNHMYLVSARVLSQT